MTEKKTQKTKKTKNPIGVFQPLRLAALGAEDVAVLSAHLQDALLRVGDCLYMPEKRRFAATCHRFCWEEERDQARAKIYRRALCGLAFDAVFNMTAKGVDLGREEETLALLAICFEEREAPGGVLRLIFGGGGEIELHVEAVEILLRDSGQHWETRQRPRHLSEEG